MFRSVVARTALVLFISLSLGSCKEEKPAPTPAAPVAEAVDKVGGLMLGMTPAEVEATGNGFTFKKNDTSECIMATSKDRGLVVLLEKGKLMRLSLKNANYNTAKDIKVGSTEQQVKDAYGPAVDEAPHKYEANGKYLNVIDANGRGYVFEIIGGTVQTIHMGQTPALQYVEGCS